MSDVHDALLASLRAGGVVESEGVLGIDFKRAREELRSHLLDDARAWVLKAVQHAAAAEAGHLTVTSRPGHTRLFHDGRLPTPTDLLTLFGQLIAGLSAHPSLPPLALALNSALALPDAQVTIACWDGDDAVLLEATADEVKSRRRALTGPAELHGVIMDVQSRAGLLESLQESGEAAFLRARCGRAPLSVRVNGEVIAPLPFGEPRTSPAFYPAQRLVRFEAPVHPHLKHFPRGHPMIELRLYSAERGRVGLPLPSLATHLVRGSWSESTDPDPGETTPSAPGGQDTREGAARRRLRRDLLEDEGVMERCHAVLALAADVEREGAVEVIVGGVHAETMAFPELLGLFGAVAADLGPLDLGGLHLREEAVVALRSAVEERAKRLYDLLERRTSGATLHARAGQFLLGYSPVRYRG
jgi:hypothetical protein